MNKTGSIISDSAAKELLDNYQEFLTTIPAGLLKNTLGVTFGKEFLQSFLDKQGSEGIDFHFALTNEKRLTLVLTASVAGQAKPVPNLSMNSNVQANSGTPSGGGTFGNQGSQYP